MRIQTFSQVLSIKHIPAPYSCTVFAYISTKCQFAGVDVTFPCSWNFDVKIALFFLYQDDARLFFFFTTSKMILLFYG